VLGVGIAHMLQNGTLEIANYGYFMSLWLAVILLLFTIPLISYTKPLSDLKKNARSQSSAQATTYHRALEREHLGKNIAASMYVEDIPSGEINDPSKEFSAAEKLSTILIRREVLLPLSAAALIPLALAGISLLPIKELFGMLKKLLLL
jgi:hypothetical protein